VPRGQRSYPQNLALHSYQAALLQPMGNFAGLQTCPLQQGLCPADVSVTEFPD
jgi:hypothetical protein